MSVCLQSHPATVSRGVSQSDRDSEEPADLFSEEASSTPSKNGLNSDDDDLFAGQDTFSLTLCPVALHHSARTNFICMSGEMCWVMKSI